MFSSYIRIAFRHLRKNKLYTGVNISGLAIALACVMLSILYYQQEHGFDRFHRHLPDLYRITTTYVDNITGQKEQSGGTGQVQGPAFKSEVPEIMEYTRVWGGDIIENVKSTDKAFNLGVSFVDSSFFKVLSFPLLYGNPSTALNERYSIVITETTARKFFGTTNVLGKRLDIEDNPDSLFASFNITGVVKDPPANSSIQFDILVPISYIKMMFDDKNWLNSYLGTFVVLHPGASPEAVEKKFSAIHHIYAKEQIELGKKTGEFDKQTSYGLQPVDEMHLAPEGGFNNSSKPAYSYFLLGISLFILVMASINFVNLSIADSLKRAKEIGIRKITGSTKRQVIVQFLVESSLVCITAFAAAAVLVQYFLPVISRLAGITISFSTLLDGKLVFYFIILLVINILLAGLYPAYVLSGFKPIRVLYNKPGITTRNYFGKGLIVFQFSISICLIIASIIYFRQMNFVRTTDLGYKPGNIVRIEIPPRRDIKHIYPVFKNEVAKEKNISSVSMEAQKDVVKIDVQNKQMKVAYKTVEESYLPMLEIPLKEGRNFSAAYPSDLSDAVIVNEAFVRTAGLLNPVGAQVYLDDSRGKKYLTIIGVMKDYHQGSLKEWIKPAMLSLNDGSEGIILVKMNNQHQQQTLAALESIYKRTVPGAAYNFVFWDQLNAKQYEKESKWETIIHAATFLSILICCLGLFGLSHLATHLRVKEIGIRKVLGASIKNITLLISADFIRLVVIAVIFAGPVAWYFMNQWLQDFPYRVSISWWIFVLAGAIAVLIAFATVFFQSLKAALANPVKSLRSE